jgi:hypothetical protein
MGLAFLWIANQYGLESPWTIWVAVGMLLVILAINFTELRIRMARLETPGADRK